MRRQTNYQQVLRNWLTGAISEIDLGSDLDQLIGAAANNGILSSLHRAKAPIDTRFAEFSALLSTVHILNTDRNQIALAQIRELATALNQIGIEPVVLKGLAHILTGIYPDLGTRYLADIDLLISPPHFPAALAVLQKLGYAATPANTIDRTIGHAHPPIFRPDSLEVDLHRTTGLGICVSFLPAAELIRCSTVHSLGDALLRIPSPEHLVIYHIMHSQMHDHYRERINPSLRTLYDLSLLERHFRHTLNWQVIEDHFSANGQYATFALYLLQAESAMGIKPPVPLRLSAPLRLRRRRREWLREYPALRFIDPSYYFLAGIRPRTRRLREILAEPGGPRYLLQKFGQPKFYARLRHDFS